MDQGSLQKLTRRFFFEINNAHRILKLKVTMSESDTTEERSALLVSLDSATKQSVTLENIRKDYENRLLSFKAITYYAKATCLSPLICARLGYVVHYIYSSCKELLYTSSEPMPLASLCTKLRTVHGQPEELFQKRSISSDHPNVSFRSREIDLRATHRHTINQNSLTTWFLFSAV